MIGACGLCGLDRELRNSHLLPAATYRLSRDPARRNPNPVVLTADGASTTSKQVSDHFLCGECEDRFSRLGERYVLGRCARRDGRFRLRTDLAGAPVLYEDERFRVHRVDDLLGDRIDQYLYFAASIVWRAGARSWSLNGQKLGRIPLGRRFEGQLRQYLLGEAPYPRRARLFVHVWNDDRVDSTSVPPTSERINRTWRHKFCIPGILFILFLGGEVPETHDAGAINSRQGAFMWLCRWSDDSLFKGYVDLIRTAIRKRGKAA